jgi:hypothetical protein
MCLGSSDERMFNLNCNEPIKTENGIDGIAVRANDTINESTVMNYEVL